MIGDGFLTRVGSKVRERRREQGLSRRQLSEISGVSERFLAQLETGKGNISLRRFAEVAGALGVHPAELLAGVSEVPGRRIRAVALLGVRGAGKSTVGARLAARHDVPFIEVDHRIEQAAGLSLSEIFEVHGEAYYRRLERQVLDELLPGPAPVVLATGGSIVTDAENYARLLDNACTVWLRAAAEDHWNRVIEQGDARPMAENPQAFSELQTLLRVREPLYAHAHHVVDTNGLSVDQVVDEVASAVAASLLIAPSK